jgi:hypothetical protein
MKAMHTAATHHRQQLHTSVTKNIVEFCKVSSPFWISFILLCTFVTSTLADPPR